MVDPAVSSYMSEIGKRGGKASGTSKMRGDSQYYKNLAAKRKNTKKSPKSA